jgi:8-hydroxy-5-deazaflavin:NADPH oxidoreductase
MKIAVIGTGHGGGALGTSWARAGHEVVFGSRTPDSTEVTQLLKAGGKISSASLQQAAASAEVIALAVPWNAVSELLDIINIEISGRILIDCTNPSQQWPEMDHSRESGGEQVANWARNARVVKAFNTTGFENMRNPKFSHEAATMFYAGDDKEAKDVVRQLASDLGFDPVDAGPLSQSRALEALASLWGGLAYGQQMGRGIAFRLLRR